VSVRTRFAPSPTGYLHVGNVRTAIFNWLHTRHVGGAFVLRIEDTDRDRSQKEFEDAILRELKWLGLDWDEGVEEGEHGPYRQSERHQQGIYRRALERLREQGDVYPCFCSPDRLSADREADRRAGRPPRYAGRCRAIPRRQAEQRMAAGESTVLRFRVPEGSMVFEDLIRGSIHVELEQVGDPVVLRSDGWPTYNFAVVVDDIGMAITDVIRGEDHISNTPRQVLLYRALRAAPPRFAHLPLVLGADHAPLSKRHGDTSLRQYAAHGYLPEAILNYLALLGWAPHDHGEVLSREELVARFDLRKVGKSAGVFDRAKLDWVGNQHLRHSASARLAELALPFLQSCGDLPPEATPFHRAWVERLMDLLKESISHLSQVPESDAVRMVLHFDLESLRRDPDLQADLREASSREVIQNFAKLLPGDRPLDVETFRRISQETGKKTGAKGRGLYHPIRVALTACGSGPELVRLVPLIEEAAGLDLPHRVPGCAERAALAARLLGGDL